MEAVNAAAGLTVTPGTATGKNKDLIVTLPVQTPHEYYLPSGAWSWIQIWVNVVLHSHFQNYLPVNIVKFYILPVLIMANSTYYLRCDMAFIEPLHRNKPNITYLLTNLLLSFKGSKYHVCKGKMGLEILYGFCGPAKYTAAIYVLR